MAGCPVERLFDAVKLFGEDPTTHQVNSSTPFHHYTFNTTPNTHDTMVDPKMPILLGGLAVSETDLLLLFDLLKKEMDFKPSGDCTLDRAKISLLYRHARLARALGLKISDYVQALHLRFDDPVVKRLGQFEQMYEFACWLRIAPFTIPEICFILNGEESSTIKFKTDLTAAAKMVWEARQSQGSDPKEVLKVCLARAFNVPLAELENCLHWAVTDLDDSGIQTALNEAPFDKEGKPERPEDFEALRNLAHDLERVMLVFGNLKFGDGTVAYLTSKPDVLGIADLKPITLDGLKALTAYKKLIKISEEAESLVQAALKRFSPIAKRPDLDIAALAELWQEDESLIQSLVDSLVDSLVLPRVPYQALEYLSECLTLCQTLGIDGFSLQKLAHDDDYDALKAARDVALGAFSSKYDDEKNRQDKLEPYQDQINVLKRDVLCDYLMGKKELRFKDRRDIYAYFLLDVEMSGDARTSRLVCAISSLQLYVQRILANLECSASDPAFSVANKMPADVWDPFHEEWEWRKNYRV